MTKIHCMNSQKSNKSMIVKYTFEKEYMVL